MLESHMYYLIGRGWTWRRRGSGFVVFERTIETLQVQHFLYLYTDGHYRLGMQRGTIIVFP